MCTLYVWPPSKVASPSPWKRPAHVSPSYLRRSDYDFLWDDWRTNIWSCSTNVTSARSNRWGCRFLEARHCRTDGRFHRVLSAPLRPGPRLQGQDRSVTSLDLLDLLLLILIRHIFPCKFCLHQSPTSETRLHGNSAVYGSLMKPKVTLHPGQKRLAGTGLGYYLRIGKNDLIFKIPFRIKGPRDVKIGRFKVSLCCIHSSRMKELTRASICVYFH